MYRTYEHPTFLHQLLSAGEKLTRAFVMRQCEGKALMQSSHEVYLLLYRSRNRRNIELQIGIKLNAIPVKDDISDQVLCSQTNS